MIDLTADLMIAKPSIDQHGAYSSTDLFVAYHLLFFFNRYAVEETRVSRLKPREHLVRGGSSRLSKDPGFTNGFGCRQLCCSTY